MIQREVFLRSEGDAWHERNREALGRRPYIVLAPLKSLQIQPKRILEIGCGNGHQLEQLRRAFNVECHGIDPSAIAIAEGKQTFPSLQLSVGTANCLEFKDGAFDVVLFGCCLCLCDPRDHFVIAKEADRVLQSSGLIVIVDFVVQQPYKNAYAHKNGLSTFKMEYSQMFLWNPNYRLINRSYWEHEGRFTFAPDESGSVDILLKDCDRGFPLRPSWDD